MLNISLNNSESVDCLSPSSSNILLEESPVNVKDEGSILFEQPLFREKDEISSLFNKSDDDDVLRSGQLDKDDDQSKDAVLPPEIASHAASPLPTNLTVLEMKSPCEVEGLKVQKPIIRDVEDRDSVEQILEKDEKKQNISLNIKRSPSPQALFKKPLYKSKHHVY